MHRQGVDICRPVTPKPITTAVRSYSIKAEQDSPDDVLSQALGATAHEEALGQKMEHERKQDWMVWLQSDFSNDPIFDPLEQQRKELIRIWDEFQRFFLSSDNKDHRYNFTSSPPTIATLQAAVSDAVAGWEARRESGIGLAKHRFFQFMETMNDHSFLFKFVPAEDKYISLLTGVVATIVKASVNHQKIAEGFSLALVEMSENLRFVQKKTKVANTEDMQRLVVALYVQVFKFLCHAMSFFYSRHKRILASLNKGFYDKTVKTMVDGIQKTIDDIRHEAQHTTQLHIENMHRKLKDLEPFLLRLQRFVAETSGESQEQMDSRLIMAVLGFKRLGQSAVHHLEGVEDQVTLAMTTLPSQQDSNSTIQLAYHKLASQPAITAERQPAEDTDSRQSVPPTASPLARDTEMDDRSRIQQQAGALIQYIENGEEEVQRRAALDGRPHIIPQEVFAAFGQWITGTKSSLMWVEGPSFSPAGPALSQAALKAIETIGNAGIPCITFFCKSRYGFAAKLTLPHNNAAVVSLLYSIILQLAWLLPEAFPARPDLSSHQFERLNGSLNSLPTALNIIRALLEHGPPCISWVIDGLQHAGSSNSGPYLFELIRILRDQETKRVSKVCFTTDGRCPLLDRTTTVRERVNASRLVQARGGRAFPGGQYMY